MSRIPRPARRLACLGLVSLATAAGAQTVGSSNTATADPTVPRPNTTPCAVQLYSNFEFADFSPKPFTYAPPAACPGPWAKVVLEADFSVTAGRQFDRTAQIAVGHVNVYYGTTAEPSAAVSPSWHVERDLTDYSPLFRTAQTGEVNLGNLVNSTFTGVLHGSARVLLYPVAAHASAPRTADAVLPLSTAPGGAELLATTSERAGADLHAAHQRRGRLSRRDPAEPVGRRVLVHLRAGRRRGRGLQLRRHGVPRDGGDDRRPAGRRGAGLSVDLHRRHRSAPLAADPRRPDAQFRPLPGRSHAVRGGAQRRPAAPGGGERLQRQQLLPGGGEPAALPRPRVGPRDRRRDPEHDRPGAPRRRSRRT